MIFLIWLIALGIHLFFVVLLTVQFTKKEPKIRENSLPSVSIVIAARNESSNLKKHLPILLNQAYSNFEIILCLDRTVDDSISVIHTIDDNRIKYIDIQEIEKGWNSKKYVLTKGINKATGDWVVLTDADCYPSSDQWLQKMVSSINQNTHIIIGFSPYELKEDLLGRYIHFESMMTAFNYFGWGKLRIPYMAVGRNLAIRKHFFQKVNGYESFKDVLGGDDDLFIQKFATAKNTQFIFDKTAKTITYPKKTIKGYWNQKLRHLAVGSQYNNLIKTLLSIQHITHLLFYLLIPFLWVNPLVCGMLVVYYFVKWKGYNFAGNRLGEKINLISLPFLDFAYAIFTPLLAIGSKIEKDIQWQKN